MSPLSAALQREIDIASRFLSVLEREQEALSASNMLPLEQINGEKAELIGLLNSASQEREQFTGPISGSLAQWLKENSQDAEAAILWEKLSAVARQAKQTHELNGKLIAMHLSRTSEALAILTHRQQHNSLYGSDGQAFQTTGSRIVDSA